MLRPKRLVRSRISAITDGVKQFERDRAQEKELLLTKSLVHEAQPQMLRHQIAPHFLFNTLNGIRMLIGEETVPTRDE